MEVENSHENQQVKHQSGQISTIRLGDKQKMRRLPKEQRQAYIKTMLAVEQLPGPPPLRFKKSYPSEDTFKYKDINLHFYSNQSSPRPRAILLTFHGMSGHSQQNGYFTNTIKEHIDNFNVYAFDQMNFGKSEGPFRGLINSLEDSVQQAERFVEFILSKLQNKPKIFLCGGSFGGSISFHMAIRAPQKYSGLILLAPGLRQLTGSYGCVKYIGKFLSCLLPPVRLCSEKDFKVGNRFNNKEEILADPLIYNDGLIPHSGIAVLNGMKEISTEYHLLTTPYILFQGGTDKAVDPFAALDLEDASPSKDKTTLYYEKMWHAIHTEIQIEEITQISIKWLKERL